MPKPPSYFSHDGNARNDDKVIALRMTHGMEGYGIYFAILERMRESDNYMSAANYDIIAFDLRVDADKVKSIVETFELFRFTDDRKYFYSESFLARMRKKDQLIENARINGAKSARAAKTKTPPHHHENSGADHPADNQSAATGPKADPRLPLGHPSGTHPEPEPEQLKVKEKEKREKNIKKETPPSPDLFEPPEELARRLLRSSWIETVGMHYRVPPDRIHRLLVDFASEIALKGENEKTENDFKSHFINRLKIEIKKNPENEKPRKTVRVID